MISFQDVVSNLKIVFNLKSDKELALKLNMKVTTFSERKRTNSIPYQEIIELCIAENININNIYTAPIDLTVNSQSITVTLDSISKESLQKLLIENHLDLDELFNIFISKLLLERGIKFEIKIPNAKTAKVIKDARKNKNMSK